MAKEVKTGKPEKLQTPNSSVSTLVTALAAKGGPGIILLCVIFITIWGPVAVVLAKFFGFIGTAKDISGAANGGIIIGAVAVGLFSIVTFHVIDPGGFQTY